MKKYGNSLAFFVSTSKYEMFLSNAHTIILLRAYAIYIFTANFREISRDLEAQGSSIIGTFYGANQFRKLQILRVKYLLDFLPK